MCPSLLTFPPWSVQWSEIKYIQNISIYQNSGQGPSNHYFQKIFFSSWRKFFNLLKHIQLLHFWSVLFEKMAKNKVCSSVQTCQTPCSPLTQYIDQNIDSWGWCSHVSDCEWFSSAGTIRHHHHYSHRLIIDKWSVGHRRCVTFWWSVRYLGSHFTSQLSHLLLQLKLVCQMED